MIRQRLLLVDNDVLATNTLSQYLSREYFYTKTVSSGEEALEILEAYQPVLILSELLLPGMDGHTFCRRVRSATSVPIIILSTKNEISDRILALKLGADDYLAKPCDFQELTARIQAVLRRTESATSTSRNKKVKCVEYPDLIVNLTNYSVICDGKPVEMPPKELELLYFLAATPNRVFTRDQLLDHVWGYEYIGDSRTIDVHIKRIREKLKKHSAWKIATVWGIGYKFESH